MAVSAFSQTSNVTATLSDPDGQTWNDGTYTINFVPTPGVPGPFTWNGGQSFTKQFTGSFSSIGVLTVSLPSSDFIAPAGTKWRFTLCPNASFQCTDVVLAVTGAAPNLSVALSSQLPAIRFAPGTTSFGYLDVEVGTPAQPLYPGALYWNVTAVVERQWNGSAWVNLAGGGSPPGGTNGQTQYNVTSSGFGGTAGELVAGAFSGADICAKITAAIAALPATGGTILVPAGNYSACAGSGGIGIAINKDNVILKGMASGSPLAGDTGATTINLAAGVTGIDITGGKSSVEDLFLMSASVGAGTDDGIRVRAGSVTINRVSAKHFGRNGIRVDGGNTGGSADFWHFEDTQTVSNFGDGMRWASPCTDNNLGTGIQLDSSLNGGWGYYIDCGNGNQFTTTHATQNTLGGVFVGASSQFFDNCYIESGVGSSFVIPNSPQVTNVHVKFQAFGQPTTITNAIAAANGNSFDYTNTDGWPVKTPFYLSGFPGSAGNKYYLWDVNSFAPGDLGLYDASQNTWLFHYNTTSKFTFLNRVITTATGILPGLNVGGISGDPSTLINGDIWYDLTANKFRCQENNLSVNCIGSGGGAGSVTHTLGPLTLGKMVIGNGAADITVDPNTTSDAAGNIILTSIQTSGANGGLAGVEGDGSGLTPGIGVDLFYADSASHCWKQNLNNVTKGCTLTAADWAVPGTIGSTTPNTGAFTTLNASTSAYVGDVQGSLDPDIQILGRATIASIIAASGATVPTTVSAQQGDGVHQRVGLQGITKVIATANTSSYHTGLWGKGIVDVDGGHTSQRAVGVLGTVATKGAGTVVGAFSGDFWGPQVDAASTVQGGGGIKVELAGPTYPGTITHLYGVQIDNPGASYTGAGAGDYKGIYIGGNSALGTANYGIYIDTTVGSPAPFLGAGDYAIFVNGAAKSSLGPISTTGQFTSTLASGTTPMVITSTTPVANLTTVPTTYNHSGTQQTASHLVRDRCTLGTDCSVTLTGSAVFTSSSTYDCVAIDRTGANAIQFAPSSGSAFALTGTGTDTISYVCVGN